VIGVANAPCSWGVIENVAGETAGYRLVLDEMAATGYAGTELGDWGFMPTDPSALRDELDARQLAMVGSFATPRLQDRAHHSRSVDDAVRIARLLAAVGGPTPLVVLGNDPYGDPMRGRVAGRVTGEHRMSDDAWAAFVDGIHLVARRVRDEAGIRTVIHQHLGTLIESMDEVRRLLDSTDPTLIGVCLDTGHWTFGTGGGPVEAVRELGDRIWHVHFKDCDPEVMERSRREGWDGMTSTAKGVFCELGTGSVDFPGVLRALEAVGYQGWIVVEQDVLPGMGDPRESARRNREFLRSIGI
jgi:inosose dehydratase